MSWDAASLRDSPSPGAATKFIGESCERIQSQLSRKGGGDLSTAKPKHTRGTRSGGHSEEGRKRGHEGRRG